MRIEMSVLKRKSAGTGSSAAFLSSGRFFVLYKYDNIGSYRENEIQASGMAKKRGITSWSPYDQVIRLSRIPRVVYSCIWFSIPMNIPHQFPKTGLFLTPGVSSLAVLGISYPFIIGRVKKNRQNKLRFRFHKKSIPW